MHSALFYLKYLTYYAWIAISKLPVILSTLAAAIAIFAFARPELAANYLPGISAIADRLDRMTEQGSQNLFANQGSKREVSDDPATQLANWGYPLGQFESGEALFLRAHSEGQVEVMLTVLETNISLSPQILLNREMPEAVWQALERHQNWREGQDLCQAIASGGDLAFELEEGRSGNLNRVRTACPVELALAARTERSLREQAQAQRDAAEAETRRRLQEEQRLRDKAEAEREALRNKRQRLAEEALADCRRYYEGPFLNEMTVALVRYIDTNGQRWDPPEYRLPERYSADVKLKDDLRRPNYEHFLSYTNNRFIAHRNGTLVLGRDTDRFENINDVIGWAMKGIVENECEVSIVPI